MDQDVTTGGAPGGGRRAATVREVAARAGVSIATVSRVLNGHTNVAPHTRELVEHAAEQLNTAPDGPDRGDGARGDVYLRCPYVLTDYFGLIVSSIAESLRHHGHGLVLDAGEAAQSEAVLPTLHSLRPGLGGAILILPPEPGEDLLALRARGFPFVVVDPRTPPPRDIAAVSAAHFAGARNVAGHLVALGHRRIGVIAGPHNWLASRAREAGHSSALADAGVLPEQALIRRGEPTTGFGRQAADELLGAPNRPTALICFNDKTAVGALAAAAERGLRIPEDLSVAGFDDIDLAQATRPQLTTVHQPLQEMGRMAVSLLIRLLERQRIDALHVELATELVVRGSTGPVPGA